MASNKTQTTKILSWVGLVSMIVVVLFELWSSYHVLSYANELATNTHYPFDGLTVIYYLLPIFAFPIFVIINLLCYRAVKKDKKIIDTPKIVSRLMSYLASQILAIAPITVLILTQSNPDTPFKLRLLAGEAIVLAIISLIIPFLKINNPKIASIIREIFLVVSAIEIALFVLFIPKLII